VSVDTEVYFVLCIVLFFSFGGKKMKENICMAATVLTKHSSSRNDRLM